MASSSSQSQPQATNLMDLPVEVRLKIYEYAIVQSGPICINRSWQAPSILKLGSGSCDLDAVTKLFYKQHAFVYYLTGLNYGEPNIQPLIDRLLELTLTKREYVKKINIVCFWACKDVTIETIQQRVEERLSKEGDEEALGLWTGKLYFAPTDEAWRHLWMG